MRKNNWFKVDVNGLAQLQAGRPKWHIARDSRSNDEAIANGYKVVSGSELSESEWDRVRESNAMPSTKELFGLTLCNGSSAADATR